jgi:hypothetical protein
MVRAISPSSSLTRHANALTRFNFRTLVSRCVYRAVLVGLKNSNTFNKTSAQNTTPVNFSGTTNLFHTNIQCPSKTVPQISASASVSLDAGADVNVSVTLGVVAAGTFAPPSISQLVLHFGAYGIVMPVAKPLIRRSIFM